MGGFFGAVTKDSALSDVYFGTDFHSPWHLGKENDAIFVVRNMVEKLDRYDRFSDLLTTAITQDSMDYKKENDHPPCTGWNQPSPNCGYTTNCRPECDLAFSLETAYFGTPDNQVTAERLLALGILTKAEYDAVAMAEYAKKRPPSRRQPKA